MHLQSAREYLRQFDPALEDFVTFVKKSSLDFIARYRGPPFEFVFVDTELEMRMSDLVTIVEPNNPAKSGQVAGIREISVPTRMRGRPGGLH